MVKSVICGIEYGKKYSKGIKRYDLFFRFFVLIKALFWFRVFFFVFFLVIRCKTVTEGDVRC